MVTIFAANIVYALFYRLITRMNLTKINFMIFFKRMMLVLKMMNLKAIVCSFVCQIYINDDYICCNSLIFVSVNCFMTFLKIILYDLREVG